MRTPSGKVLFLAALAVILTIVFMAFRFSQSAPVLARGSISLSPALSQDAYNSRTLFLVVFDSESPMPMPYGAIRYALGEDAKPGKFFDFVLTMDNIQKMGERAAPKKMRIKARLSSKTSVDPRNSEGEIWGQALDVSLGDKISIVLDQKG